MLAEKLLKMNMEKFVQFLQRDLENDFGYEDDEVINNLLVRDILYYEASSTKRNNNVAVEHGRVAQ